MKTYKIRMTVTEVTRQIAYVEAESAGAALAKVESYDFDNSYNEVDDSLEWTVSDTECLGVEE